MPRKASGQPKERKHIHLTIGSWERLDELYGSQGITPSKIIDMLVSHHIRRVEEKANLKQQALNLEALEDD